jgi:hypothetical protein
MSGQRRPATKWKQFLRQSSSLPRTLLTAQFGFEFAFVRLILYKKGWHDPCTAVHFTPLMGVMTEETQSRTSRSSSRGSTRKLEISGPILNTFTPNPNFDTVSLDSPRLKKRGLKAWARSKSRRFWVFFAMIVVFFLLAIASAISVMMYFIWQHRTTQIQAQAVPNVLPSESKLVSTSYPGKSYLIDVEGGEDEETRAGVRVFFSGHELRVESGYHHPASEQPGHSIFHISSNLFCGIQWLQSGCAGPSLNRRHRIS